MYDLIVIGGGPAGYVGAIRAAQLGKKVLLIEQDALGGTCLNRGCVPTKALLHAADSYRKLKELPALGIHVSGAAFDYERIHLYKNGVVSKLRTGIGDLLAGNKVETVQGRAAVLPGKRVRVGTAVYEADNLLIAVGSIPFVPPIPGKGLPGVVNSNTLLEDAAAFYKRLVIIGGGVIGVEMASVYGALGCEVTVIEAMDRLLPMMDREISQNLNMILKKRGVKVETGAKVSEIVRGESGLLCRYVKREAAQEAEGDGILVAIGRRANTQELFAEGILPDMERGCLVVNEQYETSIPGVFAVGDCNGKMQLAHAAEAQAMAAVEYICGNLPKVDPTVVPSCVYTDPEIACVGITADDAKQKGIPVTVGKYVMGGNSKVMLEGAERSFIKLIFDEKTDCLLGAQLMCPRATDMIGSMTDAVVNGLTAEQLLKALRPHPTFLEGMTEAIEAAHGKAIHVMPSRL